MIGGWGSRGKSGTERLKAAMIQGMGYSLFAKTTGCEAMMVAGIPGSTPEELFLYRPYDKASITEQRMVLKHAAQLMPRSCCGNAWPSTQDMSTSYKMIG